MQILVTFYTCQVMSTVHAKNTFKSTENQPFWIIWYTLHRSSTVVQLSKLGYISINVPHFDSLWGQTQNSKCSPWITKLTFIILYLKILDITLYAYHMGIFMTHTPMIRFSPFPVAGCLSEAQCNVGRIVKTVISPSDRKKSKLLYSYIYFYTSSQKRL